MARQAKQVYVAGLEKVWVWRPVRRVARLAPLNLNGFMLEHERPTLLRVTLEAGGVIGGRSSHLLGRNCAVRIVAVATRDQAFIYAVVKRHCKLRLLLQVAGVAEGRLRLNQQKLGFLGVVRGMAIQAAHIIVAVDGSREIHLLLAGFVAGHATVVHHLGGGSLETEYLGRVTGIIDMLCSRPMTTLAALV